MIGSQVLPWNNLTSLPLGEDVPCMDNLKMGKALLGVIIHPTARAMVMNVSVDNVEKIVNEGTP